MGYERNPLERIHRNVILAQLQGADDSCSAAQNAAMELKDAEKAHADAQAALQLYEKKKRWYHLEPQINRKIKKLASEAKKRKKAFDKASKHLWQAIDDEVKSVGLRRPNCQKEAGCRKGDWD